MTAPHAFGDRFTRMFGVSLPIVQAGMSWASSCVELPAAVSNAGGLGVLAAGPLRPDDFRDCLHGLKQATANPFAVNVPLYRKGVDEILDIALEEGAPILIASQGGPKKYLDRFKAAGVKWIHVVASELHARKAADAGVDAIAAIGGEGGGHPPPSQVSTLVIIRAVARAVPEIPLIAGGGIADGAGIAAVLALGADAAQLGTRYLVTREARVHSAYQQAVLAAGVADTELVGRAFAPVRVIRNRFSEDYLAAEAAGTDRDRLGAMFENATLRVAALEGDVERGKVEAGQSAGLIGDIPGAGELTWRLADECSSALSRLPKLISTERTAP